MPTPSDSEVSEALEAATPVVARCKFGGCDFTLRADGSCPRCDLSKLVARIDNEREAATPVAVSCTCGAAYGDVDVIHTNNCAKRQTQEPECCEVCGVPGGEITETIISPPVSGYPFETVKAHRACAAEMARSMES